jgi:lysophospholipase L1-like esterase
MRLNSIIGRLTIIYASIVSVTLVVIIITPSYYFKLSSFLNRPTFSHFIDFSKQSTSIFLQRVEANAAKNSIYFIGDSLVQGLNTSRIHKNAINLGIGHDQTGDVRQRIQNYVNINSAALVVFAVGINDLRHYTPEKTIEKYILLIEENKQLNNIALHAVLPVNSNKLGDEIAIKIKKFNIQLRNLASKNQHIRFIAPPYPFNKNNNPPSKLYLKDGLHLSPLGNDIWIKYLQGKVSELTEKTK